MSSSAPPSTSSSRPSSMLTVKFPGQFFTRSQALPDPVFPSFSRTGASEQSLSVCGDYLGFRRADRHFKLHGELSFDAHSSATTTRDGGRSPQKWRLHWIPERILCGEPPSRYGLSPVQDEGIRFSRGIRDCPIKRKPQWRSDGYLRRDAVPQDLPR